ncbi:hypothetical protein FRC04_000140 [Tulasnella sp. 424]|nr:hypothetical protein FRC04_000140 [Tulasnella sp. 424]KAG8982003.1 hypothetical protein FRC05_000145 [Tulasnella sp. 425]
MEDPDRTLVDEVSPEEIQHSLREKGKARAEKPRIKSLPLAPNSHLVMKLAAAEAAAVSIPPSSCPQLLGPPTGTKAVRPSLHEPTNSVSTGQTSKLLAPVDISSSTREGLAGHTSRIESELLGAPEVVESRAGSRQKPSGPRKSLDLPLNRASSQQTATPDGTRVEMGETTPTRAGGGRSKSPKGSKASLYMQEHSPLSSSPVYDVPQSSPALPLQPTSSQLMASQPKETPPEPQKRHIKSEEDEGRPAKKRRSNMNSYSNFSLAHSSVRTPFKPPTMKKKETTTTPAAGSSKTLPKPTQKDFTRSAFASSMGPPQTPDGGSRPTKKKPVTGVAAPFKSPLSRSSGGPTPASPSPSSSSSSRHTIAALEQRLQHLKQAHKIKSEGSVEKLEQLTIKWTTVARSAAEDLWQLVREAGSVGGAKDDDEWGYSGEKRKRKDADSNWGWDAVDKQEDDEEQSDPVDEDAAGDGMGEESTEEKEKGWNLGTMLESMGIPPETLGWDAEEGEFIDVP